MTLVYVVAGEASGDVLGGLLIRALQRRRPDLHFAGIGGARMIEAGLDSLFSIQELSVMGLMEVLPRVLRLQRRLAETAADIAARRPGIVVTIDSPGFTLRLLRAIRPLGIRRVHYVAPQVWAWREHRVREYPGLWERLLCLLPFEPEFFARHGLEARFVGHPVLESGAGTGDGARLRTTHGIAPDAPVLILMPGSRRFEVKRLLPVFGRMLTLLDRQVPGVVPVIPVSPEMAALVARSTAAWARRPLVVTSEKHDAFAASAAALTKSGTSTLELAVAGVPMAVAYRVNPLTAAIVRRLVKIPHAALVNLLAGRALVPELLQQDCTPERLAAVVASLLTDPAVAAAQRAAFGQILASLAPPQGLPSDAAALAVLEVLEQA